MSRPSLKTPCVADRYADKTRERIAEFDGGLIALRRQDDGTLLVSLYQLDQNVRVTVAASHLIQTQTATESAAPAMLAALKAAQCPCWVHNAAITTDIEALRRIALWHAGWNNDVLIPALEAAGAYSNGEVTP